MNPNSSDTQSAELPANAEQTEPADLAPEGDEAQAAPEVAPEVEQPAAEIPPAGTEESVDVTPTTDTPATDAEPSGAEATTSDEPTTEAEQPEQPAAAPDAAPAAESGAAPTDAAPATPARREVPAPGAGPVIIGRAEDVTPPPVPAVKQSLKDVQRQQRPRRRRLNATQRHRNVFFARLNEFRRQALPRTDHEAEMEAEAAQATVQTADTQATDAQATDAQATDATATDAQATDAQAAEAQAAAATEAAAETPTADAPADVAEPAAPVTDAGEAPAAAEATVETPAGADAPVTDAGEAPAAADGEATTEPPAQTDAERELARAAAQADEDEHSGEPGQKRRSTPPPPVDRARLVAAIERAGGPDAVLEALQPKRDENDQPLKWATVCADACKGLKPSDPVFSAWVRLAATPVSAIKRELGINERPDRGRGRGGPRRGGRDDRGPRRGRDDRGGASREDFQRLSRGGSVGANIRIIGLNDEADEKQEREARRKAEREAKRQAERDRLARLGY